MKSALPGLLVIVAASCAAMEEVTPLSVTRADSAGITIVSTSGSDVALQVQEEWRVGAVDGDPSQLFYRIVAMDISPTGSVWVVDGDDGVRGYDRGGEYRGRVGGRGDGPGESATGYRDVVASAGGVLVQTMDASTLQLFTVGGALVGSRITRSGGAALGPLGAAGDSWTVVWERMTMAGSGHLGLTWVVGRGSATDSTFDSLFSRPGPAYVALGDQEGAWARASVLEGTPSIAADDLGRTYYSHPTAYRIEVFGPDGVLERVLTRDIAPTAYDPDIRRGIAASVELGFEGRGSIDRDRVADLTSRALPRRTPRHFPFLDEILVGADGTLLVRRFDRHPNQAARAAAGAIGNFPASWPREWHAPQRHDLFNSQGVYEGSVELPADFNAMAITANRIVGSLFDRFDVEYVVSFEIGGPREIS